MVPGAYRPPGAPEVALSTGTPVNALAKFLYDKYVEDDVMFSTDRAPTNATHFKLDGGIYDIFKDCPDDVDQRKKRVRDFREAIIRDARRGEFSTLAEQFSPFMFRLALDLDIKVRKDNPLSRAEKFTIGLLARTAVQMTFPNLYTRHMRELQDVTDRVNAVYKSFPEYETLQTLTKGTPEYKRVDRIIRNKPAYKDVNEERNKVLLPHPLWIVMTQSPTKPLDDRTEKHSLHIHMPIVIDRNEQFVITQRYRELLGVQFDGAHGMKPRITTDWVDFSLVTAYCGLRMLWNDKSMECAQCVKIAEEMGKPLARSKPSALLKRKRGGKKCKRPRSLCMGSRCNKGKVRAGRVNSIFAVMHPTSTKDLGTRINWLRMHPHRALDLTSVRVPVGGRRFNTHANITGRTDIVMSKTTQTMIENGEYDWIDYSKGVLGDAEVQKMMRSGEITQEKRRKRAVHKKLNFVERSLVYAVKPALARAAQRFKEENLEQRGVTLSDTSAKYLCRHMDVKTSSSRAEVIWPMIRGYRTFAYEHGATVERTPYASVQIQQILYYPHMELYLVNVMGSRSDYCAHRGRAHGSGCAIHFVITPLYVLQHCEHWYDHRQHKQRTKKECAAGVKYRGLVQGDVKGSSVRLEPCGELSRSLQPSPTNIVNKVSQSCRAALFRTSVRGKGRPMSLDFARLVITYGTHFNAMLFDAVGRQKESMTAVQLPVFAKCGADDASRFGTSSETQSLVHSQASNLQNAPHIRRAMKSMARVKTMPTSLSELTSMLQDQGRRSGHARKASDDHEAMESALGDLS